MVDNKFRERGVTGAEEQFGVRRPVAAFDLGSPVMKNEGLLNLSSALTNAKATSCRTPNCSLEDALALPAPFNLD